MSVAPPLSQTRHFRHFACPECQGALEQVREQSTGTLSFLCRIGHRYAPRELITGKEIAIEQALWGSLRSVDELIVLLAQLEDEEEGDQAPPGAYAKRVQTATTMRGMLEQVIAGNDPVRLDGDEHAPVEPGSHSRLGRNGA